MRNNNRIVTIEDYEKYIGAAAVERIMKKAEALKGLHVTNINSTYYGGGVAELLHSLTLLMNSTGIKTGWRTIQGPPDFFSITKKMHNALQGANINLSERKKILYEEIVYENSIRNHLDHHNMVVVHDPQPLPLVNHYKKNGPWIWRCHVDLSNPNKELWRYLSDFVKKYDAVILTLPEYRQKLTTPQLFFMPAIDPFSALNRPMTRAEVDERLGHYGIPTDLPIVTQISRFDRWKDPVGVIEAFRIAQKEIDATLVLLGNVATDDPEGAEVYESLLHCRSERIFILSHQDTALVNALQRRSEVVLQKSIREGFGLTVSEAMWKGAAVIGGNAGGIRYQITDGENGFLVSSVQEAATRIVQLVKDRKLRQRIGKAARKTVKANFLLSRYLEEYLDLFGSFETVFRLKRHD
ncbi:MAG: Trehalose synthase [Syntrophorhabdaceae bacterium PtaU1.Bin034]|nr:MAG: Trehalose synthase [Syntrophorhabdaceae bacterium PtaU1.Bin034]